MKFAAPNYVYTIWLVIALSFFFVFVNKKRKKILNGFASKSVLAEIVSNVNNSARYTKQIFVILALFMIVLALMQPQWGFQWHEVKRTGLDILIAIDTSKSMMAEDVKPNRLERSKLAIKDLLKKLEGDRVGLIAFSGTAFLQCPLTSDYNGFVLALNDITVNTIPRGGTSITSAIDEALRSYDGGLNKFKVMVIITDGEDQEGDAVVAAQKAKREGIKVFCVGIGTKEGELIWMTDETGQRTFLEDKDRNIVKTRLNEDLLKRIALITGGSYIRSSGAAFGLDFLYDNKLSKMEKREIKAQMNKFYYNRFQIPLAIALILLMLEMLIGDRKKT